MTRKERRLVAGGIRQAILDIVVDRPETPAMALGRAARNVAELLSYNDPRFDRDQFLAECGVPVDIPLKT